MKRLVLQLLSLVFLASLALGQSLPSVWVDNNEATDGSVESYTITSGGTGCVAGSLHISAPPSGGTQAKGTYTCASGALTGVTITNPGLGYKSSPTATIATGTGKLTLFVYSPPTYELQLGATKGSWVKGPPSGCTFTLGNYVTTATGKQNAINDIEACRTKTGVGIILDVPPASSQSFGYYSSASGVLIPQTSNTPAKQFIIVRSTMDATLAGLPEPVCAGGIQDNLSASVNIGLINPDCAGHALAYQLGSTVTSVSSGPFTLANGKQTNTSNYNYVQYMYQDECTGTNCIALQFCSVVSGSSNHCTGTTLGPDHWFFEDGAASMSAGNNGGNNIIETGSGGATITSTSQLPTHIHFRRYWVHGDWTSLDVGSNSVSAGLDLTFCATCSVVGSQVSQALRPSGEGHSVLANGTNYKFANDWFEGSSSCIFSGGYSNTPANSFVPFQDVQIGRVRCTFPYSWLGAMKIPSDNSYWGGQSVVRKNCDEMKEGERILIYGIICENVDNSGGQNGTVSTINVRNCSGQSSCPGQNYQSTITDLTIVNSIFRNSCWGIEIAARSGSTVGDGGGVSFPMKRVALLNDLQYNVSGSNPGCPGTNFGMQTGSQEQSWQGTITGNGATATFVGNCSVDAGGCPGQIASYTITNSGGTTCSPPTNGTLTISAPATGGRHATATYTCSGGTTLSSVNITNPGSRYLSGNPTVTGFSGTCTGCAVTLTLNSGPVTPPRGFEVMDISAGDPVSISGCTSVTAFNVLTHMLNGLPIPVGLGPLASVGSAPWTGTYSPSGVTVTYPWAMPSATDTSGNCTLTNVEGGPQNLILQHHTFITDANQTLGQGNDATTGPNFQINSVFENSILLSSGVKGSGWANTAGEGTPAEDFNDDFTSMTAYKLVWPGRTASNYTEYGNAPGYSDPNGCTGTGCTPPVGWYFPATSYCTGATPTTACVGFIGAMNLPSGPMPLALADYHGYGLLSSSSLHNQALDGTDLGVIIPSLDTAQTTNQYVCTGPCGSIGPFPD